MKYLVLGIAFLALGMYFFVSLLSFKFLFNISYELSFISSLFNLLFFKIFSNEFFYYFESLIDFLNPNLKVKLKRNFVFN
jgi:hypothetical protein